MTSERADVVVIGLGVTGLSTAAALARRGHAVVGIDRWGSGHPATSSTGASRSIRVAYDDERYVRLAREAFEGWHRLEADQDVQLLVESGQVDLGRPPSSTRWRRRCARATCRSTSSTPRGPARFPEIAMGAGERALFHAEAGTVLADAAMRALTVDAQREGAELSMPERCVAIEAGADEATVVTDRRTVRADRVVIAAGPWSGELLASVGIEVPLAPAVAQVTFLEAPQLVERPGIADWLLRDGVGVYGHPVPGVGYKVAFDAGSRNRGSPTSRRGHPTWPRKLG